MELDRYTLNLVDVDAFLAKVSEVLEPNESAAFGHDYCGRLYALTQLSEFMFFAVTARRETGSPLKFLSFYVPASVCKNVRTLGNLTYFLVGFGRDYAAFIDGDLSLYPASCSRRISSEDSCEVSKLKRYLVTLSSE